MTRVSDEARQQNEGQTERQVLANQSVQNERRERMEGTEGTRGRRKKQRWERHPGRHYAGWGGGLVPLSTRREERLGGKAIYASVGAGQGYGLTGHSAVDDI